MRFKAFYILIGVLFLLFSTNAYACLFSMAPSVAMAASMPMPMEKPMPSHDEDSMTCQTAQCDAMASQSKAEINCQFASAASALTALKITPQDISAPVLSLTLIASEARNFAPHWRVDDVPRPRYSVSPLLFHSTLLL